MKFKIFLEQNPELKPPKLKPCPFCGSGATCLPYKSATEFHVECNGCNTVLKWVNVHHKTFRENEIAACEWWNTRPNKE